MARRCLRNSWSGSGKGIQEKQRFCINFFLDQDQDFLIPFQENQEFCKENRHFMHKWMTFYANAALCNSFAINLMEKTCILVVINYSHSTIMSFIDNHWWMDCHKFLIPNTLSPLHLTRIKLCFCNISCLHVL